MTYWLQGDLPKQAQMNLAEIFQLAIRIASMMRVFVKEEQNLNLWSGCELCNKHSK